MKTLTALLLLASLFIIENLFAGTPFDDDTKKDSLVKRSIVQIPVDSIIDIDSLLNDTTLFKVVSDTLINNDSLKTDSIINVPSDTIVTKKTDTISKHIPKKPVVVIPQSVIKLNKIYSEKTGQKLSVIEKAMERDNFMTPEEAKKFGLVDHIVTSREDVMK